MTMTVHNYRPRQLHRTSNGENRSSGYRDMGSASLAAARSAARPPGPWWQYPSSPEGWGVKKVHTEMIIVSCSTLELLKFCAFNPLLFSAPSPITVSHHLLTPHWHLFPEYTNHMAAATQEPHMHPHYGTSFLWEGGNWLLNSNAICHSWLGSFNRTHMPYDCNFWHVFRCKYGWIPLKPRVANFIVTSGTVCCDNNNLSVASNDKIAIIITLRFQ